MLPRSSPRPGTPILPGTPDDSTRTASSPDNAAAFRALAKIGKLEVVKTETFPIEKVDVFFKTLV